MRFAEYKFRELIAWSNGSSLALAREDQSTHHAQVLQYILPTLVLIDPNANCNRIWFHSAILDLFRPVMGSPLRHQKLRTFTSPESSPEKVYNASVNQLKQLIVNYRLNFKASSYAILWHVALTYLANALLFQPKEEDWFFYFLLCIYGYERLRPCWRVTKAISTALLSLALRKGDISGVTARQIVSDIESNAAPDSFSAEDDVRATFMADLDLASSNPYSATVEKLADDFEQNLMLQEYTNVLDGHDPLEN